MLDGGILLIGVVVDKALSLREVVDLEFLSHLYQVAEHLLSFRIGCDVLKGFLTHGILEGDAEKVQA